MNAADPHDALGARSSRVGAARCRLGIAALSVVGAIAGMQSAPSLARAARPGPVPVPALASETAPPEMPADDAVPSATEGDWVQSFRLGGGVALYFYQPTNGWQNQFLIYTNLRFDARWRTLGVHFEPRLSNEKLRPYFDGLAWIQEAYFFAEVKPFRLKAGKIYKQLGLFWDHSFYGNIQVYEGLKFDPNSGLSLEASFGDRLGLELFAQYFVIDGHTNSSLVGRDTISIPGARRRNTFAGRVQPFARLSERARLDLGFSAESFTADLPGSSRNVTRLASDLKLTWAKLGFWAEVLHQSGRHVTDYPYASDDASTPPTAGRTSADNTYLLAGAEYAIGPVTLRYDLSIARYDDVRVEEVLHLPGAELSLGEHASLLVEYAVWRRHAREGSSDVDQSLNVTLLGHY